MSQLPKTNTRLDQGVFAIMPNRPVRDQYEYLRKMERHFPIKPGQLIGMVHAIFNSFSEFEPVCQKWNGDFRLEYSDRNMWTTSRVDPEYSGQKKPKRTFPFEFWLKFLEFWHNGKQPSCHWSVKLLICISMLRDWLKKILAPLCHLQE